MTASLTVWAIGAPVLFVLGLRDLFALPGVEPANPVRGGWYLLACAFLLIAGPLTATVAGMFRGPKIYTAVCAVLTLGGLVVGGLLAVAGLDETGLARRPAPPAPTPTISHCVEFSGGDTRCPGG
jgi:hypothetical protein